MIWRPRWLNPAPEPVPELPPSDRCLFIVGAARSGTTVLQNALNESPDIFLFGEPDFHLDAGEPGFAARYNAMHRSWANQETKSTFCPAVLAEDGSWKDYLRRLSAEHRYVGAKIAINPVRERGMLDRLFDFQCRHFYRARHVFTFRHPFSTVMSTRDLQVLGRGESDTFREMLCSYAETAALYVRMARTLPQVRAVFHEDVDRATFDGLSRWLGVPLDRSHLYYDPTKVRRYPAIEEAGEHAATFRQLAEVYGQLREASRAEFPALQAEQNDNHLDLDGTHFTGLGKAQRTLAALIRELAPA
jgi:hypothetical protein